MKAWLLLSGSSPCYDPFLNPEVAIEIVFETKILIFLTFEAVGQRHC
jgi:hypothetical protein